MQNDDYRHYKELIDTHLLDFLPEIDQKSNGLSDAMRYSLSTGGKRLRPVLLLAASEFCGYDIQLALPYACAIEYIHTYSLIHDDLPAMDDDDWRRGAATNHKVYGENVAILAGDGLLSSAFEAMMKDMLLYFDSPKKLKCRVTAAYEIAKGSGCRGMIAGQMADIESEGQQRSREFLDYIHINKTAALLRAAVRAGAYLACAEPEKLSNLTMYAECIGLGYQIVDDLLDVEGELEEFGKNTGSDAKNNKSTFATVYTRDEAKERLRDLTNKAIEAVAPYYDDAEFFVKLAEDLAVRVK